MAQQLDPRLQPALAYLRYQGQKELTDLRREVERTAVDFNRVVAGWSEEEAHHKPSPTEWSVVEVLHHLAAAMELSLEFIPRLAHGEVVVPTCNAGSPSYGEITFGELSELVHRLWAKALAMIDDLPASLDTVTTRNHPLFGPLNCKEWIAFLRLHGMDHVGQIEQIRTRLR